MSNWFENNPTKSVIVHTLVVAAATWAAFTFIFDESKVQLNEAKISKAEAASKEVSARNGVLVTRVEYLTIENEKLYRWLETTPNTIPYYEKTISDLKTKIKKINKELASSTNNNKVDVPVASNLYELTKSRKSGTSFVDPKTNAVIGVRDIDTNATAFVNITLPDGQKIKEKDVSPGETWGFKQADVNYHLILDSVDWATQSYKASIVELPKEKTLNE